MMLPSFRFKIGQVVYDEFIGQPEKIVKVEFSISMRGKETLTSMKYHFITGRSTREEYLRPLTETEKG